MLSLKLRLPKVKSSFFARGIIINNQLRHHSKTLDSHLTFKSTSELNKLQKVSSQLSKELRSLDNLTKKVKESIKSRKIEIETEDTKNELNKLSGREDLTLCVDHTDIDDVFESLDIQLENSSEKVLSSESKLIASEQPETNTNVNVVDLFPKPKPFVNLPSNIIDKISEKTLGKLSSRETADWKPILNELIVKTDLKNLDPNERIDLNYIDFHQVVKSIPKGQRSDVVDLLHHLAYNSGIMYQVKNDNPIIVNDLLALCHYLEPEQAKIVVEKILEDVDTQLLPDYQFRASKLSSVPVIHEDGLAVKPDVPMKSILINHYSRLKDVQKVKIYIDDLNKLPDNQNPLMKSPVIYTNVMQMYMRLNDYRLARETFDTMNFLSLSTSPSSRTYSSMILMDTLNNDIEHGIDVYQALLNKKIKPEPDTLLALAKGCATRGKYKDGKKMIQKGWNFVIEYYNNGFAINEKVMETMMYLSYIDGDLPFVRSIWMSVCENRSKLLDSIDIGEPRMIKWLFNTYYRMGDILSNEQRRFDEAQRTGKMYQPWKPIGLMDDNVKSIRNKVLNTADFDFNVSAPPLLPQKNFVGYDGKLVLSEARAVWKYVVTTQPQLVSEQLFEAFMYVLGRYGSIEEFKAVWRQATRRLALSRGQVSVEEEDCGEAKVNEEELNSPIASLYSNISKFERSDRLYNMCLHVCRHQGDLDFAQSIWKERGGYRKSTQFQSLTAREQNESDFKFARLMLSLLVELGHVEDGYKMVLSSKSRFLWQYYHLKSLIVLCERLGYITFKKELLQVVKRSQQLAKRSV